MKKKIFLICMIVAFPLYGVVGQFNFNYEILDQNSVEWQVYYFTSEIDYLIKKSNKHLLDASKAREAWSALTEAQSCLTCLVALWTNQSTQADTRFFLAKIEFDIAAKRQEINNNVYVLKLGQEFQNIEN